MEAKDNVNLYLQLKPNVIMLINLDGKTVVIFTGT